jgi:signal transduction histidine kinase
VEFLEDDSKTREEILGELRNLRTRLQEVEEARQVIRKEKNNQAHRHAEEETRWTQEREDERASAGEILHFEKMEHRHSEEELGKTREQLRDVSFKLLQAEETERKRIAQEIHDGVGQHWVIVKHRVETILKQLGKEITAQDTNESAARPPG